MTPPNGRSSGSNHSTIVKVATRLRLLDVRSPSCESRPRRILGELPCNGEKHREQRFCVFGVDHRPLIESSRRVLSTRAKGVPSVHAGPPRQGCQSTVVSPTGIPDVFARHWKPRLSTREYPRTWYCAVAAGVYLSHPLFINPCIEANNRHHCITSHLVAQRQDCLPLACTGPGLTNSCCHSWSSSPHLALSPRLPVQLWVLRRPRSSNTSFPCSWSPTSPSYEATSFRVGDRQREPTGPDRGDGHRISQV